MMTITEMDTLLFKSDEEKKKAFENKGLKSTYGLEEGNSSGFSYDDSYLYPQDYYDKRTKNIGFSRKEFDGYGKRAINLIISTDRITNEVMEDSERKVGPDGKFFYNVENEYTKKYLPILLEEAKSLGYECQLAKNLTMGYDQEIYSCRKKVEDFNVHLKLQRGTPTVSLEADNYYDPILFYQ